MGADEAILPPSEGPPQGRYHQLLLIKAFSHSVHCDPAAANQMPTGARGPALLGAISPRGTDSYIQADVYRDQTELGTAQSQKGQKESTIGVLYCCF